jgi:hypothetical protein
LALGARIVAALLIAGVLIEGIPGASFVIEVVVIGTVIGNALAYWQRERDPTIDIGRRAAYFAAALLGVATASKYSWC